jgi:Fic family protein
MGEIAMKIPRNPPDFKKLIQDVKFDESFALKVADIDDSKYLHWDKLRHLKPPVDLTHEEWWIALKLRRFSNITKVPFTDSKGHPFSFTQPVKIVEHLHHIDQDAAGEIMMQESEIANKSTQSRFLISSLVEEAITSSQLEGAATTREIAKDMIRTKRPPRDTSEQMILNNYYAMRHIHSIKDKPLTKELILELHRILTEKAIDKPDAAGRFRRSDEIVRVYDLDNVVLHTPPAAELLDTRMAALYDFANNKTPDGFIHPVLRAIILHFCLAYEHPFADGNGRCARALFYWSMLRQGYWLCEYLSISHIIKKAQAKYGRAFLYTETDDNDLTYFILYHLETIRKAIRSLHEYIARKRKENRRVKELIRANTFLNHRQVAILTHAIRNPRAIYTVKSHMNSHNVRHQTARTDLQDLSDKGLLCKKVGGRAFKYTPADDLENRLRNL